MTTRPEGMREADGLGLGLSIVDRIARVLGLEIRLKSRRGYGTSFSVLLPVAAAIESPVALEAPPTVRGSKQLTGTKVLCIDNDARILDGMRRLLEGWGCKVETLSGSGDLHVSALVRAPSIILADYHLDGEDGLQAVHKLRQRFGADIPAILITADRSNEVREAAEAMEIPVLNKPVRPAALRTVLTRQRNMPAAAE